FVFFLMLRPPPSSPLFPYTTLFRSRLAQVSSCPTPIGLFRAASAPSPAPSSAPRRRLRDCRHDSHQPPVRVPPGSASIVLRATRSEEHTSELQSRSDLVCRLLLEKK